ncbi:NADH-quinone oxidoreductase subunit C [Verrucomicrobiales bacterium]|nr:NADH-quinone oxidoreductase subunit C [Verrucomicrobiales bacterium]
MLTEVDTQLPDSAESAVAKLREKFPDAVKSSKEFRGEQTIIIDAASNVELLNFCRDTLGFDFLVDVCSVDNAGQDPRFEVVYHLYSYTTLVALRVKAFLGEDEPTIDSVAGIWATADWHEREVYDMMGITFANHRDLRRILMWEGYPFYPLRKEFPLGGKPSEMPDVAFTGVAQLEGGPFVTAPGPGDTKTREPRSRDQDRG